MKLLSFEDIYHIYILHIYHKMACLQILTYTMFDFIIDYSTVDLKKKYKNKY